MKLLLVIICGIIGAQIGYSEGTSDSWIYAYLNRSPRFIAAKELCEKGHVPLICMIESESADSADIYIGENMGDHTNRIATARVSKNGIVKYLSYDANGEELWIADELKKCAK